MEPALGRLEPAQELAIAVTLMSRAAGPLDLLIGCEVEGSQGPLVCALTGEV